MSAGTSQSLQPRAPRFDLSSRGEIFDGSNWVNMMVLDVSDGGLSLVCTREFPPGEVLNMRMLLPAGTHIECTAEIRHSSDMGTGAKIVSMDDRSRRAYDHYLQEFYTQDLGRFG